MAEAGASRLGHCLGVAATACANAPRQFVTGRLQKAVALLKWQLNDSCKAVIPCFSSLSRRLSVMTAIRLCSPGRKAGAFSWFPIISAHELQLPLGQGFPYRLCRQLVCRAVLLATRVRQSDP